MQVSRVDSLLYNCSSPKSVGLQSIIMLRLTQVVLFLFKLY